jgi:hypothetical protein
MAKKKKTKIKKRNLDVIMHIKGEINLSTRSESNKKNKYNRKNKHKGKSHE